MLSYLAHNGFSRSFERFKEISIQNTNLSAVCNHNDSVNKGVVLTEDPILKTPLARYRSNSIMRKDSEGGRNRRSSFQKNEALQAKENQEVTKLLSHRSGALIRD